MAHAHLSVTGIRSPPGLDSFVDLSGSFDAKIHTH